MTMKPEISNKWRNKLSIKDNFEDEVDPELVIRLCGLIIPQLKNIQTKEATGNLTIDEKYNVDQKLEDLISDFEFAKELADGTIGEDEFDNYAFDGDFEDLINGYISQLYDLGDERVLTIGNVTEKFIWVD